MRKVIDLVLLLILAPLGVSAQTVQNSDYKTIAHIKPDGTMQDSNYKTIGHIKSDGTVQDSNYRTIGHIKSDGTVQDSNYKTIGHAKGVSMEWAALYFFFRWR